MKRKRMLASEVTVKDAKTGKVKRIDPAGQPWSFNHYTKEERG